MSSDRRRRASRLEFQPADYGQSNSNDRFHDARHSGPQSLDSSSSFSTAHRRIFSTNNSHMTNTDESAHSVEINTDSQEQILLRVYREQDTNSPMLLCHRRNVTQKVLRSYSVKLVEDGRRERIDNENCLVVLVSSAVNANAFRLMVNNIGEVPRVTTSGSGQRVDINFAEFFELCIVLWSHVCKIDHWMPVAEYIRDWYWEDDFVQWPPGRLSQWLFIALVFDWPSIFEMASNALIVDFSEMGAELRRAHYLPYEVISAMTNARRDYMQKTHDEIRSISLSLTYDDRSRLLPLPQDIRADLLRAPLHLDLGSRQLPEDIHERVSPGDVLKGVRETVRKAHSVSQDQTPMHHPTQSTTQSAAQSTTQASTSPSLHSDRRISVQQTLTQISRTTRTAEAGDAMLDIVQEMWRRRPRFGRNPSALHLSRQQGPQESAQPAPLTTEEIDNICEDLLHQLDKFQKIHLHPLYIDNFSLLRAQHVLSASAS